MRERLCEGFTLGIIMGIFAGMLIGNMLFLVSIGMEEQFFQCMVELTK